LLTPADRDAALGRLFTEDEISPATVDDVIAQETFASKLRKCPGLFGKPFHRIDLETRNAVVFRRLQQIVNTMNLNPLWKERILASGVTDTPRNYEQWQQLPITDRETLNAFYMGKHREGVVVPLSQGGFEIIASGGTSGGLPIETVYSQRELHDTYEIAGHFMGTFVLPNYLQGNAPRWIITTLTDYEMWSSGTMIGGVLQRTPGVNFVAAGPMSEPIYHHAMSFDGPKAIMGMSREIESLIPLGQNMPRESRESFRLAIYGSGIIQSKKIEELKALYPNLQILSYFASNQAEAIGMQLRPDAFLTGVPGLHLIEIVDANGKWVEIGEEGELVITRLHATEAPILRMQLGDRMIRRPDFHSETLIAEQFEFAGRSSDILHLGESHYAARPFYTTLCEILHRAGFVDIDKLSHEVQLQNNRKEKILHLIASMDFPEDHSARLRSQFSEERLRECFIQALKQALSFFDQTDKQFRALENIVYRFDIRFVDKEAPEIHRTRVGKVPLIRDLF
jgi:phenylacetate-CoA ligase